MDMFNSGYDKARKPYVPIDTCSPAGTWIEEKRYNKGRPTARDATGTAQGSTTSRKVLCGNWQEEAALEGDLLKMEAQTPSNVPGGRATVNGSGNGAAPNLAATFGASLDVIHNRGDGRYAGGFKSSPYLTADVANPTQRDLLTTHRADFTATSSDVKALARPELGVRSQLLLQQALAAAEVAQQQAREETAARQSQHAQQSLLLRSQRAGGAGMSAAAAATATALADPDTVYTDSVYKTTVSNLRAHESTSWDQPTIDELRQDYLGEEAITLYTGNPETGKTMTVHGKTPVDPASASRFGKHTHFSESKYQL